MGAWCRGAIAPPASSAPSAASPRGPSWHSPAAIRQGLRARGQPPRAPAAQAAARLPGARRAVRTPGTVGSPQAPALTPAGAAITAKAGACAGG